MYYIVDVSAVESECLGKINLLIKTASVNLLQIVEQTKNQNICFLCAIEFQTFSKPGTVLFVPIISAVVVLEELPNL